MTTGAAAPAASESQEKVPEGRLLGGNYLKLLGAHGLGNLGDGIALIALPWYASTVTDSAVAVAAVAVALRLPWLLLALFAGVVGDRVDRRRIVILAATAKAAVLAVLAVLVAAERGGVVAVLILALAIGCCEVFYDNTNQTLIPAVVSRDRLERANGTLWGVETVTNQFVGPPVAGFLIAATLVAPFAVQAVMIALAAVLLTTLRGDFRPAASGRRSDEPRPTVRAMLTEGLRWLWRHPVLRPLAVVLGLTNAMGAMTGAVLVLFAQDVLDLGSKGFGLVVSAAALGGVAGSVIGPWLARHVRPGAAISGVLVFQAGAEVVVALVATVPVVIVASALIAVMIVWWNVVTVSFRQRIIPDHLLSRVNSAYRTLGWGMIPLGALAGGALVAGTEPALGREWALRVPYLVAAGVGVLLALVAVRTLNTRVLRAAEAAAEAEERA